MGYLHILTSAANIPEAFLTIASTHPDELVYAQGKVPRTGEHSATPSPRVWEKHTYHDVLQRVTQIAHLLQSLHISPGDRVAICSNTRGEWSEADYAILLCGGVTVSLYPSLLADEIHYILKDSTPKVVIVENIEILNKIREAQSQGDLASMHIFCFEPLSETTKDVQVLREAAALFPNTSPPIVPLTKDSLAAIVYTSGTTGEPKGVMQTHGNHLTNVIQAQQSGIVSKKGSIFLYLPLAHSFARLIHHIGFLTDASISFPAVMNHQSSRIDLTALAVDIREANCHHIVTVPRLLEKMKAGIEQLARGKGRMSRLIARTIENASRHIQGKRSLLTQIMFLGLTPIRRAIRKKLFGVNYQWAIAGGAKLPIEVNTFFDSLEMPVYEGYGLTETCVATNVNLPHRQKRGSVGQLFPHLEIRIESDGEILFRGPNVTLGYYKKPKETAASWDKDGWFHTGDIGHIDEDGFLFITDRKKDIIITAGGKNIAPLMIEAKLKHHSLISQAVLIGDGRPYCVALLTINQELISHSRPLESFFTEISEIVRTTNNTLPSFEQIKRYKVLEGDFTIDNGLLTPTLKPRRKLIMERYKATIDELYREQSSTE